MVFLNQNGKVVAFAIVNTIRNNKDELSEIDGLIGDGDHGINMNKGMTLFAEKARGQILTLDEAFQLLGQTLLMEIGGSVGPLYGTFFLEMARQAKGEAVINGPLFAVMLQAALKGIQSLGSAKIGDKTLVDCLQPATEAFQHALEQGDDFDAALQKLKQAALAGRDSTKVLVAKVGRASRLGERSRGVLDAGAVSCCLMLCAMADAMCLQGQPE